MDTNDTRVVEADPDYEDGALMASLVNGTLIPLFDQACEAVALYLEVAGAVLALKGALAAKRSGNVEDALTIVLEGSVALANQVDSIPVQAGMLSAQRVDGTPRPEVQSIIDLID